MLDSTDVISSKLLRYSGFLVITLLLFVTTVNVQAFNLITSGVQVVADSDTCENVTLGTTISFDNNSTVIAWIVYDGFGASIASGATTASAEDFGKVATEDFSLSAISTFQARPLTLEVYSLSKITNTGYNTSAQYGEIASSGKAPVDTVIFDPAGSTEACLDIPFANYVPDSMADWDEDFVGPQRIFIDGRINAYDAGTPVVLYGQPNDNDEWRLEVYSAASGRFMLAVPPSVIHATPRCPEENTMIMQDRRTGISFWHLPTRGLTTDGTQICPFQLNAPSTERGKTYVIIFYDLYPYSYYESQDVWLLGQPK